MFALRHPPDRSTNNRHIVDSQNTCFWNAQSRHASHGNVGIKCNYDQVELDELNFIFADFNDVWTPKIHSKT